LGLCHEIQTAHHPVFNKYVRRVTFSWSSLATDVQS
jgi:hypothetical protein